MYCLGGIFGNRIIHNELWHHNFPELLQQIFTLPTQFHCKMTICFLVCHTSANQRKSLPACTLWWVNYIISDQHSIKYHRTLIISNTVVITSHLIYCKCSRTDGHMYTHARNKLLSNTFSLVNFSTLVNRILFIMSYYWTEHITDLQVGGEEVSWNEAALER